MITITEFLPMMLGVLGVFVVYFAVLEGWTNWKISERKKEKIKFEYDNYNVSQRHSELLGLALILGSFPLLMKEGYVGYGKFVIFVGFLFIIVGTILSFQAQRYGKNYKEKL